MENTKARLPNKVGLFFMEKQRIIVYIDGFNFYYGLRKDVRWKKYYWLDIVKLFEMFMRPNQELVMEGLSIKYLLIMIFQYGFCLLPHLSVPKDIEIIPGIDNFAF